MKPTLILYLVISAGRQAGRSVSLATLKEVIEHMIRARGLVGYAAATIEIDFEPASRVRFELLQVDATSEASLDMRSVDGMTVRETIERAIASQTRDLRLSHRNYSFRIGPFGSDVHDLRLSRARNMAALVDGPPVPRGSGYRPEGRRERYATRRNDARHAGARAK